MLKKIQSQLKHLSKSKRKVAKVILASPNNAIHSSIAAIALKANVSKPTVNRFCRSINTRSFPNFKLHLAQSLANSTPYVNRNVNKNNSVKSYTKKIFKSAIATLNHVRHSLNKSAINRAVNLLTQAKKIAFFKLGSSAAVAHNAINKFFRFNVPVVYSNNIVLQRISCINCSNKNVVVLISHTKKTKNLVKLAQLARKNNAIVIALTSAGTPLAQKATLAITLNVPKNTNIYMPIVSQLAQLTVINVLATKFTLQRSAKFKNNLKQVKKALKKSRFNKQLLNLSDDR